MFRKTNDVNRFEPKELLKSLCEYHRSLYIDLTSHLLGPDGKTDPDRSKLSECIQQANKTLHKMILLSEEDLKQGPMMEETKDNLDEKRQIKNVMNCILHLKQNGFDNNKILEELKQFGIFLSPSHDAENVVGTTPSSNFRKT